MKFWTCPNCGSNLDHGELCNCQEAHRSQRYDIPVSTWKALVKTVGTMKEIKLGEYSDLPPNEKECIDILRRLPKPVQLEMINSLCSMLEKNRPCATNTETART